MRSPHKAGAALQAIEELEFTRRARLRCAGEFLKRAAVAYLVIPVALCLFAQPSRDDYRQAYKSWREADPMLERDAAAGGAALSQRIDSASADAAKFGAARTSYWQQWAGTGAAALSWTESAGSPDPPLASPRVEADYVAVETALVTRNIGIFADDPDKGIQELRQALERERTALAAVSAAIADRQGAADAAGDAAQAVEQARMSAFSQDRDLMAALNQIVEETKRENTAWTEYYRSLAASGQNAPAPAADARTNIDPGEPSPRPPDASLTPVPLPRYVGSWTYPATKGLYHGPEPDFVDLVVEEENGHASGTLIARFKLPPGGAGDPVVRFDFSGDFKNTRNQVFALETSDGAKGTIELIPGAAFNLLEVNFQTEPKAGKVGRANMVLLKK